MEFIMPSNGQTSTDSNFRYNSSVIVYYVSRLKSELSQRGAEFTTEAEGGSCSSSELRLLLSYQVV